MAPSNLNRPTAVELFAGVGGFALGLESELRGFHPDRGWDWKRGAGRWQVVWANQWEPTTRGQHAADGYRARFPGTPLVDADVDAILDVELAEEEARDANVAFQRLRDHALTGHVRRRSSELDQQRQAAARVARWTASPLPERFDLLVGGFPCQDYSVAKTLRQASGIVGPKGVLWWQIERIIRHRRPAHVLLENVDRLLKSPTDDRGRDFAIMLATFAYHGYEVEWRVINAANYGLPQRRRRVFIHARRTRPASGPTPGFLAEGPHVLTETGLFARTFPATFGGEEPIDDLLGSGGVLDPKTLSSNWGGRRRSPWRAAGYMRGGQVLTADVAAPTDDRAPNSILGRAYTLGDILLDAKHVLKDPELRGFLVPRQQLDPEGDTPRRGTWDYLKGPKRDPRRSNGGFAYDYSEGGIAFPEPQDRASRTIVTGEGGSSPSRFKLVVEQEVPDSFDLTDVPTQVTDALLHRDGRTSVYRRLTPIELERLNMFPDDWTKGIGSDSRRAFTMGNALVVGVVEQLGRALADELSS